MKRVLSFILCILLFAGVTGVFADYDNNAINDAILTTGNYLYKKVPDPSVGSIGGEWLIFGLSASDLQIPDEYFENYYKNVQNYVIEKKGMLHKNKYTEYARVTLALVSIGKDPQNVCGYNLIEPLFDFDKIIKQGLNGPIWALIALDSKNFGMQDIKEKYVNYILKNEISSGGWALTSEEKNADVDITAMALVALSKHKEYDGVTDAIERGLNVLSQMQNFNGGYEGFGAETSESSAQVLVALSQLGIYPSDERFIKGGHTLVDNILSYYISDGGFRHTYSDVLPNQMASEQAFYALVAVARMIDGKNSLFDMSNKAFNSDEVQPNGTLYIKKLSIINTEISFYDVDGDNTAILELAKRGILNGKENNLFYPESSVTRAEFAAIVVRSLGLPLKSAEVFSDVKADNWFYEYVNTAFDYKIVKGISENKFNPNGIITREEAAVMVARASELCGVNTDYDKDSIRNVLSLFSDYISVSDWAKPSLAFCYDNKLLDTSVMYINPKEAVTRAEIAQMIYNMLCFANLI